MNRDLLLKYILPSIVAGLVLTAGGVLTIKAYQRSKLKPMDPGIESYEECVSAGYEVKKVYPSECKTPGGLVFIQDPDEAIPGEKVKEHSIENFIKDEGASSGYETSDYQIIEDETQYFIMWKNIYAGTTASERPDIDFEKKSLIAVFMGVKPTAGYDIEVKKVEEFVTHYEITVMLTQPGESCITADVITKPYHIVLVDKIDTENHSIRFIEQSENLSCD